jgi:hypothetical protein
MSGYLYSSFFQPANALLAQTLEGVKTGLPLEAVFSGPIYATSPASLARSPPNCAGDIPWLMSS